MWSKLAALVLIASLAGACVDGDTSNRDIPQPGDNTVDDDYPEVEQEIRAARQAVARADLLLEVSGDVVQVSQGEILDLVFHVTSIDSDFVNAPTITIALPLGISVPDPPTQCELLDRNLTCLIAPSILSETGDVPVSADPFGLALQVGPDAPSGTLTINAFVESLDNPVDNDPDPNNNSAVVELNLR